MVHLIVMSQPLKAYLLILEKLYNMCMLYNPLFHFDVEPKAVDSEGYDCQQKPFDVVSEKLTARAVKTQSSSVKDSMFRYPFFFYAHSPRVA